MVVVRLPLDNVGNNCFDLLGCPSQYSAVLIANHKANHPTNQLSLHACALMQKFLVTVSAA